MALYLYCSNSKNCDFYDNFAKQRNERIDVIFNDGDRENIRYNCLPLKLLNDGEISMSDELINRLPVPEGDSDCTHLTLLNLLAKLGKKKSDE